MKQDMLNNSKALVQKINSIAQEDLSATEKTVLDNIYLLDALLVVRSYVEDVESNTQDSSLNIKVKKEDANGWPSFQLHASFSGDAIGRLIIGAQSRRAGPVLFFRNTFLDKSVELSHHQYSNPEELLRSMKRVFREFVDELEDCVIKGKQNGAFDKTDEREFAELDLMGESGKVQSSEEIAKISSGIYSDLSLEGDDEGSLGDLDLFS